jgi:hypothetical protein
VVDAAGIIGIPVPDGTALGQIQFVDDGSVDLVTRSGLLVSGITHDGTSIGTADNGVVVSRTRPPESQGEAGGATLVSVIFLDDAGATQHGVFVVIDGVNELSVMPAQGALSGMVEEPAPINTQHRFIARDGNDRPIGFRFGYNSDSAVIVIPESPLAREMIEVRPDLVLALTLVELQKQAEMAIEDVEAVFFQLKPTPHGGQVSP